MSSLDEVLERLRVWSDGDAWSTFYSYYTPILHRWAQAEGLADSEVDDFIQDVWLEIAKELVVFQRNPRLSFDGWMRTIVRHGVVDRLRKRRERVCSPKHITTLFEDQVLDPQRDSEEMQRVEWVRRSLSNIRGCFRGSTWDAFCGVAIDGKSPTAVAAELGISVDRVHVAKSRVLRHLRSEVERLKSESGNSLPTRARIRFLIRNGCIAG